MKKLFLLAFIPILVFMSCNNELDESSASGKDRFFIALFRIWAK